MKKKEKTVKITTYEESGPFPSTEDMKEVTKVGKGLREQINDKIFTYNEKFTVEKLEEILTELSKGWKQKAKKENRFLEVYQEEDRLGFKLKTKSAYSFYTGIGGFIAFYNNAKVAVREMPVKLNGIELDDEQTEVFWKQFKIMKKYYESTK